MTLPVGGCSVRGRIATWCWSRCSNRGEAARRFAADARFTERMARIQPQLERAVPGSYETAYEVGTI